MFAGEEQVRAYLAKERGEEEEEEEDSGAPKRRRRSRAPRATASKSRPSAGRALKGKAQRSRALEDSDDSEYDMSPGEIRSKRGLGGAMQEADTQPQHVPAPLTAVKARASVSVGGGGRTASASRAKTPLGRRTGVFSGHSFVVTGLVDKHKVRIVELLEENGGRVLSEPSAEAAGEGLLVVGHASGCRRPSYIIAVALGAQSRAICNRV